MAEINAIREQLMQELQDAPDELLRPMLDMLRAYQRHPRERISSHTIEQKLLLNQIHIDTTQWSFHRDEVVASRIR